MFELENYKENLETHVKQAWLWATVEKPAMDDLSQSMKEVGFWQVGFWQLKEGD